MFYLLKWSVYLMTTVLAGSGLQAASAQSASSAKGAQGQQDLGSDTDQDEQALDQGEATDQDVIIMEEDEDSEQG
jgi:hypothetical protein